MSGNKSFRVSGDRHLACLYIKHKRESSYSIIVLNVLSPDKCLSILIPKYLTCLVLVHPILTYVLALSMRKPCKTVRKQAWPILFKICW